MGFLCHSNMWLMGMEGRGGGREEKRQFLKELAYVCGGKRIIGLEQQAGGCRGGNWPYEEVMQGQRGEGESSAKPFHSPSASNLL